VKGLAVVAVCAMGLLLCSCQGTPGEVVDKVLVDFGVREKPEDYVSGSDRVFEGLNVVAKAEMKRMNQEARRGEVKFQEEKGLRGKYYKEVKRYEDFHPQDARPAVRTAGNGHGYVGYIEYSYRIYQSARKNTRAEAAAEPAGIPTDQVGRETYRYRFAPGGVWDGAKGEKVRR